MCIFCEIIKGNIPSYKVYEDDICMAFLDISQATIGHTLIVPKNHFSNIFELDKETSAHLGKVVNLLAKNLKEKLNIDALNVLNNNGENAGQTVNHFHIHLIPRYKDDSFSFSNTHEKFDEALASSLAEKISKSLKE